MRDEIEELKRLCIRHVVEAREAATMAERERCARLAEGNFSKMTTAEAIRAGK